MPDRSVALHSKRALVAFGCPLISRGQPNPSLLRRLEVALDEAERDPDALIVVTGGARNHHAPEGQGMRDWLVGRGIEPSRIVVEDKAWDTLENAEFVAPLLKAAGVDRVAVVTERYHLRRAHELLHQALVQLGVDARLEDVPVQDWLEGKLALAWEMKERLKLLQDRTRQRMLHRRA